MLLLRVSPLEEVTLCLANSLLAMKLPWNQFLCSMGDDGLCCILKYMDFSFYHIQCLPFYLSQV